MSGVIPGLLPDELLRSHWDRMVQLSPLSTSRAMAKELLGAAHRSLDLRLPTNLGAWERTIGPIVGRSALEAIRLNTMFPVLAAGARPSQQAALLRAMLRPRHGPTRSMGRLLVGDRSAIAMRCPQCDAASPAYRRRIHQLIGVGVCPIHPDTPLVADVTFVADSPACITHRQIESDLLLAAAYQSILEMRPSLIARCRNDLLARSGFPMETDDVKMTRRQLSEIRDLVCTAFKGGFTDPQLTRTIRDPNAFINGLRGFLNGQSASPFWTAALHASLPVSVTAPPSTDIDDGAAARQLTVTLAALAQAATLTEAGRTTGIDVTTLSTLARAHGITFVGRPSKLTDRVVARMSIFLARGDDIASVAKRYHVSAVSVYRVLRYSPGVAKERSENLGARECNLRRSAWSIHIATHCSSSPKELRRLRPADWMWLYRHDRDWLHAEERSRASALAQPPVGRRQKQRAPASVLPHLFAAKASALRDAFAPKQTSSAMLRAIGIVGVGPRQTNAIRRLADTIAETTEQYVARRLGAAIEYLTAHGLSLNTHSVTRTARLRPSTIYAAGLDLPLLLQHRVAAPRSDIEMGPCKSSIVASRARPNSFTTRACCPGPATRLNR